MNQGSDSCLLQEPCNFPTHYASFLPAPTLPSASIAVVSAVWAETMSALKACDGDCSSPCNPFHELFKSLRTPAWSHLSSCLWASLWGCLWAISCYCTCPATLSIFAFNLGTIPFLKSCALHLSAVEAEHPFFLKMGANGWFCNY